MADKTMCKNKDCPLMTVCKRSTGTPNPIMQSYITFRPYRDRDGNWECDFFLSE